MKRNKAQRVSGLLAIGLAVLALTPAASAETAKQIELEKEAIELINQLEEVAREAHYNAERLVQGASNTHMSKWSHYHHLDNIRSLVNEGLRPALTRLEQIQGELPEWKQGGIATMMEAARNLAADTNSAILNKNAAGAKPAPLNPEYRQLVANVVDHSEKLMKTADAASNFATAKLKAAEAGLKVPAN